MSEAGGVEIIAEDYPWAEDGLLIWEALNTYVSDYLVRQPPLIPAPGQCVWKVE